MILWEEYNAAHPQGYAYSRFCAFYRAFERRLSPTMRQTLPDWIGAHLRMFRFFGGVPRLLVPDTLTNQALKYVSSSIQGSSFFFEKKKKKTFMSSDTYV